MDTLDVRDKLQHIRWTLDRDVVKSKQLITNLIKELEDEIRQSLGMR